MLFLAILKLAVPIANLSFERYSSQILVFKSARNCSFDQ